MNATIKKYSERFWKKVEKGPGCWVWKGYITPKGYGRYGIYGKTGYYAHRFALLSLGIEFPKSSVLDHICKNRACVKPEHLRAVSISENTLAENSNSTSAVNKRKTHCIKGHELSGKNLAVYPSGRRCKTCDRARDKARYAEGKDAESFFETL